MLTQTERSRSQQVRNKSLTVSPPDGCRPLTSAENMQSSFFDCPITEEDLLDNTQLSLICTELTGSSSQSSCDDRFGITEGFEDEDIPTQVKSEQSCDINSMPPDMLCHNTKETREVDPSAHVASLGSLLCSRESLSDSKLSSSMYDVSKLPCFPLESKQRNLSSDTIPSQSYTTVGSFSKSKDSGFPRSVSCLSLNSGKNYDHVQSKVKEYIKGIKEASEASRRKRRTCDSSVTLSETCSYYQDLATNETVSPQALISTVNKLREEVEEKDRMLSNLQQSYDVLLMKYAASQNRIDHLRINSVCGASTSPHSKLIKPRASPNLLLLPNLCQLNNQSNSSAVISETNSELLVTPKSRRDLLSSFNSLGPYSPTNMSVEKSPSRNKHQSSCRKSTTPRRVEISCVAPNKPQNQIANPHENTVMDPIDVDFNPINNFMDHESLCKDATSKQNGKLAIDSLSYQMENPIVKVKWWQESLCLRTYDVHGVGTPVSGSNEDETATMCSPLFLKSPCSFEELLSNKGRILENRPTKEYAESWPSADIYQSSHNTSHRHEVLVSSPMQPLICNSKPAAFISQQPNNLLSASTVNVSQNNKENCLNHIFRDSTNDQLHKKSPSLSRHKSPIGCDAEVFLLEAEEHVESLGTPPAPNDGCESWKQETSVSPLSLLPLEDLSSCVESDFSLIQCLDDMDQCAQKLRVKSGAIIEALEKQLKL